MNRVVRRTLCLLLCLLLAATAGGCVLPDSTPEFTGSTDLLSVGSPLKHYFERLTDKEKAAYNAVLSKIGAFPERIEVPVMTRDELNEMYAALLYDNPELFFLSGDTTLRQVKKHAYLYPEYRMDAADYDAMFRKCSEIASLLTHDAREKTSEFERERVIHDRLIAMCAYSDDDENIFRNTIYGVLCGGEAACEGYAKTTKYLLDLLDIPCFVVLGNSTPPGSRTESHMWNAVQLHGDWYYLDLTWDDPVLDKGGDLIHYAYFNVTDETLRKTHKDYTAGISCTATKDNFFVHENLLFTQLDDEEMQRAAAFAVTTINAGSDGFQLRFADQESYRNAQDALFEKGTVYTLLKQIEPDVQRSFATNRVTYFTSDEDYTIEILLES